jgi:hypothetical protein
MDSYQQTPIPTPEKPKKLGFWQKLGGGALSIAIIIHVILAIAGAFYIAQRIFEPEKKIDFLPGGGNAGGGERGAQTKVQQKKRAQITPSTSVKRVFAEGASSTFSIPDPGDNFGEMSPLSSLAGGGMSGGLGGSGSGGGFGSGHGTGTGLGLGGAGTGKLFGLIPETMRKRCSKDDRLQRLKENGGTPACEEAVTKGLRWLKSVQNSDGSWGGGRQPAMTGLALLCYFGHCETPASEEFGDSCTKAIVYLVNLGMQNNGRLASNYTENSWPYEHAIATYALGEALTFCKELKLDIPNLPQVTEMAGQFIIDNQNKNGGWAYLYATEGGHVDSSVTGWQIQALKACSHTNIKFKGMTSCITKALRYMSDLQNDQGGFGYASPTDTHADGYYSLTGVGVLCNQMWGRSNQKEVRKGAKYILENTKFDYNTEFCDLYGHYYESQAMMQRGGEEWQKYNEIFRDQLISNQDADGSWKEPGTRAPRIRAVGPEFKGNKVYRTTLCILMLEVYYRFLATSGGGHRTGI